MSILLSDTQQKLRHAPGHLKISHTHTHTHRNHTQSCTTALHYRVDQTSLAQLWCMHVRTHRHTHTQLQDGGSFPKKISRTHVHVQQRTKQEGKSSDENHTKCKRRYNILANNKRTTNEERVLYKRKVMVCVRVCVCTHMCLNTSGAGSAEVFDRQ